MRPLFLASLLFVFAAPASAQEWRMAPEYDVLLSSYDIEPGVIRLKADEPVRLRFVNNSRQRHEFAAPAFFRSAELRGLDSDALRGGALRVAPFSARTIALVPRAGRYHAGSRNPVHRLLGFHGTIVVE